MHYEVELALIMGKTVRDLKENDTKGALDAIDSRCHTLPKLHLHPR